MASNENKELVLLDLFSGTGGFHKGLADAGFQFKKTYYSEIDKHAIANYKYNYPNAEYIGAVENIIQSGIRRPDIITFGSPCQDFSLAGNREGLAGNKSSLIKEAIIAISHFRPDIFIWENVKGAFSSNSRRDFWAIIKAFADIGGYAIEWQLVNTSWLLPQNRERIYLVGHLATSFRNWRNVFPITQDEGISHKKDGTDKRQSQTENCTTIRCNYGQRADDTFVRTSRIKSENSKINKVGRIRKGQDGIVINDKGLSSTIVVGHGVVPIILVDTDKKDNIEIGDSIDLKSVNQDKRGNVNRKGITPTLDTRCYQGVVVQLNPSTESNNKQPYQQNRIYGTDGISPAIPTDSRSPLIASHNTFVGDPVHFHKEQRIYTEVTPTIQASYGTGGDNIPYVNNIRRLTEIECERLQGFPDNWTRYGDYNGEIKLLPKTQRYKLLGNAVTAKMVEMIGKRLLTNYKKADAIRLFYSNPDTEDNRQAA
ncbi:DNA cytosine methyltransferase [Dysgonomonas sp. 25]|uniref:DNA cytosine methyltransferase n=1 Tax=Dysgonomonas sp. 25 TaxID=2302933 RepID=UPI0013D032D7|nr:DNA (cytosine-5-)-methyltransferase [Dysgonomonas sp. 25]NDV68567.1 DNA (cytosine-5-)-methyltransferase [Dysgonomonas sp. 25]